VSCDVWDTQLGPRASRDDRAAANPATPLLTLRWTLSAKRACVWPRTASLIASLFSPASAPVGLRGAWVVRRHVVPARVRGVLACPSASRRRGRHEQVALIASLRRCDWRGGGLGMGTGGQRPALCLVVRFARGVSRAGRRSGRITPAVWLTNRYGARGFWAGG
jgi:hypothetical protein